MIAFSLRNWLVASVLIGGSFVAPVADAAGLEKAVRALGGLSHQKVPDEHQRAKDGHASDGRDKDGHANDDSSRADHHAPPHDQLNAQPSRTDGVAMPAPPALTPADRAVDQVPPVQTSVATEPAKPVAAAQPVAVSDEARAQAVINGEQKQAPPHPLQVAAPNENVIVCEAGCGDARAHVVYSEPKTALRSVVADAPGSATALTGKTAECRGGCAYPGLSRSQPGFAMSSLGGPRGVNPELGAWMTSVSAAVEAPAAAPVKKSLREDWLARINREREAKAAATPVPATEPN